MFQELWSTVRALLRDTAGGFGHIIVVALSAGIALLLPAGARQFLSFWSRVEHDKLSAHRRGSDGGDPPDRLPASTSIAACGTGPSPMWRPAPASSPFFPRRTRGRNGTSSNSKKSRVQAEPPSRVIGSSGHSTFGTQSEVCGRPRRVPGGQNHAGESLQPGKRARAYRRSTIPSSRWTHFGSSSAKVSSSSSAGKPWERPSNSSSTQIPR